MAAEEPPKQGANSNVKEIKKKNNQVSWVYLLEPST